MANNITGNPWVLDTVGNVWYLQSNIRILNIEFQDYINDADTCELQDNAGRVVWSGNGNADLSTVRSGDCGWIRGLVLTVLTNGKVRVFHK